MRRMTFRLGIAALFGSLGLLGCMGEVRQDTRNEAQRGDAPERDVIVSAGRGSISSFKGDGAPAGVAPKGNPPSAAPTNDACSGEVISLTAGGSAHVDGTLVEATDDYTVACADTSTDPDNPDVVYQLDITGDPVTVVIKLAATGFDPAMQLRLVDCATEDAGDLCTNAGAAAEEMDVTLPAGSYSLIVKSADMATGAFTLDLAATTPVCGADYEACAAPSNDTCQGELVALTAGYSVNIDGTLIAAGDDLTTFCSDTVSDPGNPDVAYELQVTGDITLTAVLTATNFNPAMSIRLTTCGEELGGDTCLDLGSAAEHTLLGLGTGTYWLVVDSADGSTGPFTLDLTATTPACGDGVVNPGEQCDPGTAAESSDDGCWNSGTQDECTFGEPALDTNVTACPGYGPVSIDISADPQNPTITRLGPHNNGSGGVSQQNDTTQDLMICGWPALGPENVYQVTPTSDGTIHARIGHDSNGDPACGTIGCDGDFILYARKDQCAPIEPADPTQQLACVDFDAGGEEILEITFPVTADSNYWVFVDGLDTEWGIGPYYLELWLVP